MQLLHPVCSVTWFPAELGTFSGRVIPANIINFQSISYQRSRTCSAYRDPLERQMQTIEITDPSEARRCRFAQYRGHKAMLILNGEPVTGMIHAVNEDNSSTPMRWTVTVVKLAR
jgi:hypothetical protein